MKKKINDSLLNDTSNLEIIDTISPQDNATIFNSFGIGLLRSASITQGLSDLNPPSVTYINLVDESVDVSLSSDIIIEFSEPIFDAETGEPITTDDLNENLNAEKYGSVSRAQDITKADVENWIIKNPEIFAERSKSNKFNDSAHKIMKMHDLAYKDFEN